MKVLVVGYGSMGMCRIKLYRQLDEDVQFVCEDSNPERIKPVSVGKKGK